MPSMEPDVALWIVATPIGTLGDLSPRAREVLGTVQAIAAEDTRRARQLLSAVGVPAPELIALHAHNEAERAAAVAERARTQDVALLSDAGTPAVSDPGGQVVAAAHALDVEIRSVPGPSALAAALAASGLPVAPSTFVGFAPRKGRAAWARSTLQRPETLVIFEAPTRLPDLVAELASVDPVREACMCREISKKFEQILRRPLLVLADSLREQAPLRGECVLVVGPGAPPAAAAPAPLQGDGIKDVAAALAARWGVPRRDVYRALLDLEGRLSREG